MVTTTGPTISEQAARLHAESIVIDAEAPHFTSQLLLSDRAIAMAREMLDAGHGRSRIKVALGECMAQEMADDADVRAAYLDAWRASGVTAASSSLYDVGEPWTAWDEAVHELAVGSAMLTALAPDISLALTGADIRAAHAAGTHTMIHNMQNTDSLGDRLNRLDTFYSLGVRILQITYNLRNRFGDGCLERRDGGLSRLGESLVERMNGLGMLIDVSHCSDETTLDAAMLSTKPVACTHTSARAISRHARGKPDEVLRAVADKGGFIGVLAVPFFILPPELPNANANLARLTEHVHHIIDVAGSESVGIGRIGASRSRMH